MALGVGPRSWQPSSVSCVLILRLRTLPAPPASAHLLLIIPSIRCNQLLFHHLPKSLLPCSSCSQNQRYDSFWTLQRCFFFKVCHGQHCILNNMFHLGFSGILRGRGKHNRASRGMFESSFGQCNVISNVAFRRNDVTWGTYFV